MLTNIKNILNIPGTSQEFDFSVPDDRMEQVNGYVFHTPVQVKGNIAACDM